MADLPVANPAEARKIWECTLNPSTRRVAKKLSQSGTPISHMTVSRWRSQGWPSVAGAKHPIEKARAALDDAVPVLNADPLSTTSVLIKESAETKRLRRLTDEQLITTAARELTIALIVVARAIQGHAGALVIAKTRELSVLLHSLTAGFQAALNGFCKVSKGKLPFSPQPTKDTGESLDAALQAFTARRNGSPTSSQAPPL